MRLLAITTAMLMAGGAVAQPSAENPAAAAARKRRDTISSVAVSFDMKEIRERGTVPKAGQFGTSAPGDPNAFPTERVVMESEGNRLVMKGQKVRYESNHPIFSSITGKPKPERVVATTDGANARKLRTPPTGGDRTNRIGLVSDLSHAVIYRFDFLAPLLLACDGTDPVICHTPFSEFTPTGGKLTVNGAVCEEYRHTRNAENAAVTELWASAADDHNPRRVRHSLGGKVSQQVDVVKFRTVGAHTFPAEWTLTRYHASGAVTTTNTITVRDIEVNPPVGDDQFTIEFPPGLDVEDLVAKKFYLVRDDGSWMELQSGGEDSALIRAEAKNPWWGRNKWLLLGGVTAAVIVLFGLWRARARRRRNALPSGSSAPPTAERSGASPPLASQGDER